MKFLRSLILVAATVLSWQGQSQPMVETADIRRFWKMYDGLGSATTKEDSVQWIQREYLDQASPAFAKFIKARRFTATEYQQLLKVYPGFWRSVRPLTEAIEGRSSEILHVFDQLEQFLPGFKQPDVCFAIGCIRTGGTTSHDLILVGAEIAAANTSVDKQGMNGWHQQVLGQSGDIVAMVAHEAVHTCQRGFPFFEIFSLIAHHRLRLLNMAITEGSADFVTKRFLGLNINARAHAYGQSHACELMREFKTDINTTPFDYKNWLYNFDAASQRPPDLGYYVGSMISAGYYDQAMDKRKALKTLLHLGKYKKVYTQSGFESSDCFQ